MNTTDDRENLEFTIRTMNGLFDEIKEGRMAGKIPTGRADKMLLRLEATKDKADRLLTNNRPLSRTFNTHCVMLAVSAGNLTTRFD